MRAVYLALGLPAVVFPTRIAISQWLPRSRNKHKLLTKTFTIFLSLGFALVIAMIWCVYVTWEIVDPMTLKWPRHAPLIHISIHPYPPRFEYPKNAARGL